MLSRTLIKKQPGRRWLKYIAAAGLLVATLVVAGIALAVHDLKFQLDGDVIASTGTNVGGHAQPVDWDSLFNADTTEKTLPAGFTASAFSKDFETKLNKQGATVFSTHDASTFTTGSKDTLDINPGWQCAASNNVLSKNDIMNAYAVAYTQTASDPNPGHQILYFALERNSNNGDANVAFWFLQGEVSCDSSGGTGSFQGHHVDGDLLVVSAFTNGGGVSTIDVYRWNGGANGSLGTTSVGHGVDCISGGGTSGGDSICATTNGGDSNTGGLDAAISTPWLTANTADGLGHTLQPSEFFEGGVDLTSENLGGHCFNTFVGDTRSSQSLTATIFDYALGQLGECTSTTTTTPVDAADTTLAPLGTIPGDPNDAKVLVKDKTVIDVAGITTFSGSISWHICGPTASSSTALCTTGGVDLGSQNITAKGTYYSPTATVTAAGRYCFRAEFTGDSSLGVPGSSDSSSGECFTVAPRQASLTTQATTGPVAFGGKISDTVNLSNTAHKPGTGGPTGSTLAGSINPTTLGGDATGNITVVAYGPDSCSTVAFTSGAIAASGNGSYGGAGTAFEFTPAAPGQYVFVAAYAGDLPNTLAIAATACADAPSSEKVTVEQIPTEIKTRQSWIPNDTATVSATTGNLAAGGTVAFSLFDNATCSGTAVYTESKTLTGGNPTEEVSTSNTGSGATGFKITTAYGDPADSLSGRYSWKVVYTPAAADTAHTGKQSSCDAEHFNITYTNDAGPGSNLP
jgi:hypothetical protein